MDFIILWALRFEFGHVTSFVDIFCYLNDVFNRAKELYIDMTIEYVTQHGIVGYIPFVV